MLFRLGPNSQKRFTPLDGLKSCYLAAAETQLPPQRNSNSRTPHLELSEKAPRPEQHTSNDKMSVPAPTANTAPAWAVANIAHRRAVPPGHQLPGRARSPITVRGCKMTLSALHCPIWLLGPALALPSAGCCKLSALRPDNFTRCWCNPRRFSSLDDQL